MSPTYPEASVQRVIDDWWQRCPDGTLKRGRLVKTIVPYPDRKPFRLVPQSRGDDARQHQQAQYRIEEFRVGQPVSSASQLPVAGLPLHPGETFLVRKGKTRPAIVLAAAGTEVDRRLTRNAASWQHKPTVLLAPYYGVQADGSRGGWNDEFVGRIQRAEYSQYVWDILPISGSDSGSILRLDHLFPVGFDPANWTDTGYCLADEPLKLLDEWVTWHLTGILPDEGMLSYLRTELAKL